MITPEEALALKPDDRLHFERGWFESAGYFVSLSKDGKTISAKMAELGTDADKLVVTPIRNFNSLSRVETQEEWDQLTKGEKVFK